MVSLEVQNGSFPKPNSLALYSLFFIIFLALEGGHASPIFNLDCLRDTVCLSALDLLAGLLDLLQHRAVVEGVLRDDLGSLGIQGDVKGLDACGILWSLVSFCLEHEKRKAFKERAWVERRTFELLEDALDGAGAAAAGHGDVELVGVRHFLGGFVRVWKGEEKEVFSAFGRGSKGVVVV